MTKFLIGILLLSYFHGIVNCTNKIANQTPQIATQKPSLFKSIAHKDKILLDAWYEVINIKLTPEMLAVSDEIGIASGLKIALEADKLLFVQFLIHLFASLNMLLEGIVPLNLKSSIRSQCIMAIILNKFLDILRSLRVSPSRQLGTVDVTLDVLQDTKSLIRRVINFSDGYIIAYAFLALLTGPKSGSSLPLIISQIPFYLKYITILVSSSTNIPLESLIPFISNLLPNFGKYSHKELQDFLPRNMNPESPNISTTTTTAEFRAGVPLVNVDIAMAFAVHNDSSIMHNMTSTQMIKKMDIKKDFLELICYYFILSYESLYFINYAFSIFQAINQHKVTGFLTISFQMTLLFLIIQYMIVRWTTIPMKNDVITFLSKFLNSESLITIKNKIIEILNPSQTKKSSTKKSSTSSSKNIKTKKSKAKLKTKKTTPVKENDDSLNV